MTKRTRIYWLCQFAGWFTSAGLWLLPTIYSGETGIDGWRLALSHAAGALMAITWTHVYRLFIRRRGWVGLGPLQLLVRVMAASPLLGVAIAFTAAPFALLLYGDKAAPLEAWAPWAVASWSWNGFLWSVVYFGVHYFERWRQAERDKLQLAVVVAEAKLHGLMSQLNPHFLFNCLNSVRALIVEDPAKAQATVTALSQLMRYSLQAGQVATVPLETEMEMVKTYLSLEGVRLDERLTCSIDVAAETRSVPVPTMLVQSLVENGVKHGIERLPAGGRVGVACWLEGGDLRVRVTNSGRIAPPRDTTQVGLSNARERLRLLYGGRAGLLLHEESGSVVAELSVPLGGAA